MYSLFLIFCGFVLLVAGGESLVKGATQLAARYGLSPLFVGVVIVGLGTSAPELVVSVDAMLGGHPALAAGNVIGSNIANCLLVLAVAGLLKPMLIVPDSFENTSKWILMGVTIVVAALCWQTLIPRWQGAAMVLVLVAILWRQYFHDAQEPEDSAAQDLLQNSSTFKTFAALIVGLIALPVGADLLVSGSSQLAKDWGVSEGMIAVSIVAIGTSLPELATCIVAVRRGAQAVAYGNVIGSNLFNLLGIFGVATLVGPMKVPFSMATSDVIVMVVATGVALLFVFTRGRLGRVESGLLLAGYVSYLTARFVFLPTA